jgi:hypothetical protein
MRAVLLECMGKQRYIFATNKLREMVGASELVATSTTDWVDAVTAGLSGVDVTSVVRVSGQALLTVVGPAGEDTAAKDAAEEDAAQELIWQVTRRALLEAPDLLLLGMSVAVPSGPVTAKLVQELRAKLDAIRQCAVPPEARGARLPVVASCQSSGAPAEAVFAQVGGEAPAPLSAASAAKRRHTSDARERMGAIAGLSLVEPGELESQLTGEVRWLGVVHADGNAFGAIFANLDGETYGETYRRVSGAIDDCTKAALRAAAAELRADRDREGHSGDELPLVPLIVGGDDLTALIDGRYALSFAASYLRAFERITGEDDTVRKVLGRPYLTASAGVAVVKPHFPFANAYQLCEQACTSAKALTRRAREDADGPRDVSALDWHVHYDSTGGDLKQIRDPAAADKDRDRAEEAEEDRALLRRPYVVADRSLPPWLEYRKWASLTELARTVPIRRHPEPGAALPASQLIRLQRMLAAGDLDASERLYGVLCRQPGLGRLLSRLSDATDPADPQLFTTDPAADGQRRSTLLLDYLDAVEFLPGSRPAVDTAEVIA